MKKVCLVSTGQPSTNPRLLKEADTLSENGYEVTVVCSFWSDWAYEYDKEILNNSKWKCVYAGGTPYNKRLNYYYSRGRYKLARKFKFKFPENCYLSRTTPELIDEAKKVKADLYIGHNLGALPAVVSAAKFNNSKCGFDAEDFHSGMSSTTTFISDEDRFTEYIEKKYLGECDYISSASKKISEAYSEKYDIDEPVTILNLFPLSLRPAKLRDLNFNDPLRLYWFSQTVGEGRGLEDVIKALGALNYKDIEFHILGNCSKEYLKKISDLSEKVSLDFNQIIFHKPESPMNMIKTASLYDIGFALEQPDTLNRNICLTNKIFTYMLAGNAIIATDTEGQKEIIDTVQNSIKSYTPGDIEELASIIKYWYANRNELQKAMAESWENGTSTYNWDMEKTKFLELVERII